MVGLLGLWLPGAFGFSSDESALERRFDRWMVRTNSAVIITASFTNAGAAPLSGFFYSEQVPSGLTVTTLSVLLNGQNITNYLFEFGQDGDVYAGCTPYRWVLEQPPAFVQTNSVPAAGSVQITYSVSSSSPGTFNLQQFSWAGQHTRTTNVAFGYSENTAQQSVGFITSAPTAILSGRSATNGMVLQLDSLPGYSFWLEASADLSTWTPLVTNTAPFSYTDTNVISFPWRFYRGAWLP
jgi:uncharacterized repeat protein (TIGR01451 family)